MVELTYGRQEIQRNEWRRSGTFEVSTTPVSHLRFDFHTGKGRYSQSMHEMLRARHRSSFPESCGSNGPTQIQGLSNYVFIRIMSNLRINSGPPRRLMENSE